MILEKLKDFPKEQTLKIATLITTIPFVIITLVFVFNEIKLETLTSHGVLDFELAWSTGQILKIFLSWGPFEMETQAFITWVDYIYIPVYGLWGALCILLVSRKLDGKLQDLGIAMMFTPMIAGIFDSIENANLLLMATNPITIFSNSPFLASLFATFKIGFLAAGITFLVLTSLYLIIRRKREA